MADLDFLQRSSPVQIVGGDEQFAASVLSNEELAVNLSLREIGVQGSLSIGTTAIEIKVGASALPQRKIVTLYNNSNRILFWGYDNTVTITSGTPLNKGELAQWAVLGDTLKIYAISDQANQNARITEAK